jgi:predicted GIY-YIG superfamily endonuclease
MPDYSKGKIYKLTCETGKVYIGSTITSLALRLSVHKQIKAKTCCSTKDFINPKIELIESFPCETKEQLLWKEREWVEKTECVNVRLPIRTNEEKKEQTRKARNNYFEKNKEKEKERRKEKFICECGGFYTYNHKARHLKSKKHLNYLGKQ